MPDIAAARQVPDGCKQRSFSSRQPTDSVKESRRESRLVPARANVQLAFCGYTWEEETRTFIPHEVNVLTLRGAEIEEITAFLTPDAFARFGLPDLIPA